MIKVYYCRRPAAESEALVARLPLWRRQTLSNLKHESARLSCIGAGLLWRRAMEENGLDPARPVHRLGAGKPVFTDGGAWFSLSHSGEICLCAVADGPVGADVQEERDVKLSVARRFCPEEQRWLLSLPAGEQRPALLALWARKEAWVKAVSRERMVALDEYNVRADGPWRFTDFCIDGCYAALCGRETAPAPQRIEIN